MMKVLIIGGSYFVGRLLTMSAASRWDITLVNRGHYSMKKWASQEYHFDRHDAAAWEHLPIEHYDAVIDLCAYQQNDISTILSHFRGTIRHYLLVSTVDVYQRGGETVKDESYPLETRQFGGEAGEYITQKIKLETELQQLCQEYDTAYTILRPGQIYGPFNYAPRESQLISRLVSGLPLYDLSDAQAVFQMVYVQDVVSAIISSVEKQAYQKIYNVVAPQVLTYHMINDILQSCHRETMIETHTILEAMAHQYPLIYPLYAHETELYHGEKICYELSLQYTSPQEGFKKTYAAFLPVFQKQD